MKGLSSFDMRPAAVTFAEAGEHETAKKFLDDSATAPQKPGPKAAKKPYAKVLIFGAISLSAYVFLFKNEQLVTQTYTAGGWHAAFPVLTAFFFSFIHGAFGSNLLSVLGLEAKKK